MFIGKATKLFKRLVRKLSCQAMEPPATKASTTWEEWSIGIYGGTSPFNLEPLPSVANPVLTRHDVLDVPALLVADPFMLRTPRMWFMFFEVMNQRSGKGEIALASSENGARWAYEQIILTEPFHLSYPYVFDWMGEYYMIPESFKAGSIRLYRAVNFPTQWQFVATLLEGPVFLDSSIFRYNDRWWLFTETNPLHKYDTLRLYYADNLLGPWVEHPKSPIIEDNPHIARPAGRILTLKDSIIRYAQDCYPNYGTQVRAFEVTELTLTSYTERQVSENPVISGSGSGWNAGGMHQVDPHPMGDKHWIACVDGWSRVEIQTGA